jgi:hypothetical protein
MGGVIGLGGSSRDNTEQIADNRRPEMWAAWLECGSICWCGDVRKSGSFAPALKVGVGHPSFVRASSESGRYGFA